jgi:hypothetical protein
MLYRPRQHAPLFVVIEQQHVMLTSFSANISVLTAFTVETLPLSRHVTTSTSTESGTVLALSLYLHPPPPISPEFQFMGANFWRFVIKKNSEAD